MKIMKEIRWYLVYIVVASSSIVLAHRSIHNVSWWLPMLYGLVQGVICYYAVRYVRERW
jgi:hypothetical protein